MAGNNGVFPELVLDIGTSTSRTPTTATQSPLAQTVENALREVLAWRPRAGDAKGFTAALNQVFSSNEVDGQTTFTWTPRSYAVQADMGAVTGAQASIFSRAKAALDQSVPLLEGLFPLRADNDEEDVDAIRSVVISKFTELVNELSMVGGPRLPRVKDYFVSLLGERDVSDPELVTGLFGQMRDEFGLQRELVNTISEEQNLTNYLISVDHVISLHRSWQNLQHFFDHTGTDVFLGTQLVELSRQFAVVAESVQEFYFVLDSVFLGAAERQTVRLRSGLTIDELFSWVERFSLEEAPSLIRDGGKDGVIAFRSTVTTLSELVDDAWRQASGTGSNPQQGFHHPRTAASLDELNKHIQKAALLTDQLRRLPRPDIQNVKPNLLLTGVADQQIVINGSNFQLLPEVWLTRSHADSSRGPTARVNYVSPTTLLAYFDLREPEGVDLTGEWTVVVKNPDGGLDWKQAVITIERVSEVVEESVPLLATQVAYLPPTGRALQVVKSSDDEPEFHIEKQVSRIRTTFNKPLGEIKDENQAFLLQRERERERERVEGKLEVRERELFFGSEKPFAPGNYTVSLIGSSPSGLVDRESKPLNKGTDSVYRFTIVAEGSHHS